MKARAHAVPYLPAKICPAPSPPFNEDALVQETTACGLDKSLRKETPFCNYRERISHYKNGKGVSYVNEHFQLSAFLHDAQRSLSMELTEQLESGFLHCVHKVLAFVLLAIQKPEYERNRKTGDGKMHDQ